MRQRKSVLVLMMLCTVLMVSGCQSSETNGNDEIKEIAYPTSDITWICVFSAGGGSDLQMRVLAPIFEEYLPNDVNVAISCMPGGGGAVGTMHAWKAAPDGYTMVQLNMAAPIVQQVTMPEEMEFRVEEMGWLGIYTFDVKVLTSRPDFAISDWEELIEYNKETPLKFGTSGAGSPAHIETQIFADSCGLNAKMVHYEGSSEARAGLMRGEIDLMVTSLNPATKREHEEGSIPILTVFSDERNHHIPDIPTGQEYGMPDEVVQSIVRDSPIVGMPRGFATPPGVPDEILEILRDTFWKTVNDQRYKDYCEEQVLPYAVRNGEDTQKWVDESVVKIGEMKDYLKTILE